MLLYSMFVFSLKICWLGAFNSCPIFLYLSHIYICFLLQFLVIRHFISSKPCRTQTFILPYLHLYGFIKWRLYPGGLIINLFFSENSHCFIKASINSFNAACKWLQTWASAIVQTPRFVAISNYINNYLASVIQGHCQHQTLTIEKLQSNYVL